MGSRYLWGRSQEVDQPPRVVWKSLGFLGLVQVQGSPGHQVSSMGLKYNPLPALRHVHSTEVRSLSLEE